MTGAWKIDRPGGRRCPRCGQAGVFTERLELRDGRTVTFDGCTAYRRVHFEQTYWDSYGVEVCAWKGTRTYTAAVRSVVA